MDIESEQWEVVAERRRVEWKREPAWEVFGSSWWAILYDSGRRGAVSWVQFLVHQCVISWWTKNQLSTHHLTPNGKTPEPSVTIIPRHETPTLNVKHPSSIQLEKWKILKQPSLNLIHPWDWISYSSFVCICLRYFSSPFIWPFVSSNGFRVLKKAYTLGTYHLTVKGLILNQVYDTIKGCKKSCYKQHSKRNIQLPQSLFYKPCQHVHINLCGSSLDK